MLGKIGGTSSAAWRAMLTLTGVGVTGLMAPVVLCMFRKR